jgi:hypothetical protein
MPPTEEKGSEFIIIGAILFAAGLLIATVASRALDYQTPYDDRVMAELTRH